MLRNIFFGFYSWFLINNLFLPSTGNWISDYNIVRQINTTDDVNEEKNETSFVQTLVENSSEPTNADDNLFWTIPETNDTKEDYVTAQTENNETASEEVDDQNRPLKENGEEVLVQDSDFTETKPTETTEMDEKIILKRMNCHLEIAVDDTHDLKIQIKFDQLQNHTSGKCCITLNGPENSQLAVLISNIQLYQNGSDGEILKVIIANHGSAFVLKEYHHGSKYQPLILTETCKVYLVLYYNVTNVSLSEEKTQFDLEVLIYNKYENHIPTGIGDYSLPFSSKNGQSFNKFYT